MPAIVDYSLVLPRMTGAGYVCNYPNSGAFGFGTNAMIHGWITRPDPTIKPALLQETQIVSDPAKAATDFWQTAVPATPAWIMPASHWHFELHDGSRDWLPELLRQIGIDPTLLENRADGSAIEFAPGEAAEFSLLLTALLQNLRVSDFTLAFPRLPLIALVHHHSQLWWQTTDQQLLDLLRRPKQ